MLRRYLNGLSESSRRRRANIRSRESRDSSSRRNATLTTGNSTFQPENFPPPPPPRQGREHSRLNTHSHSTRPSSNQMSVSQTFLFIQHIFGDTSTDTSSIRIYRMIDRIGDIDWKLLLLTHMFDMLNHYMMVIKIFFVRLIVILFRVNTQQ